MINKKEKIDPGLIFVWAVALSAIGGGVWFIIYFF